MDQERPWATRTAIGIGERIALRRAELKMSAQQLADRCAGLGMPAVSRIVITKLENGRREVVSTAELQVLAMALEMAPAQLLFPIERSDPVEVLPGLEVDPWAAYQWFMGASSDPADKTAPPQMGKNSPILLRAEHDRLAEMLPSLDYAAAAARARARAPEAGEESAREVDVRSSDLRAVAEALARVRDTMSELGQVPPELPAATAGIMRGEVRHGAR